MTKTNAIRLLEKAGIPYETYDYSSSKAIDALSVASFLKEDPRHVFKTLVTMGKSRQHYVFVVPADKELSLKKAAKACDEKSVEMIPQKDLLPLTGYVHGGCSPIGMKKAFRTYVDISAETFEYLYVSAGRIGLQVRLKPDDLFKLVDCQYADIAEEARR